MYIKINYTKHIKNLLLLIKILVVIYCIFYNVEFIANFRLLISYIHAQNEFADNEEYLKYCANKEVKTIDKYKRVDEPKVSIISPIYNKERYILRFLKSIQYQNFNDLEIVFVDDFSIDNSVDLIEKYQKDDERIVLVKNSKNKGTFISRNLGVLAARGKYIMISDSDDILSKNIVSTCYKYAEEHKYEMIRFNMYMGKERGDERIDFQDLILEDRPVYQPELSTYLFYGNHNDLQVVDSYITNKFLLKEVYVKAVNSLSEEYLNMFIIYMEESMMNYMLYRTANSLYFIRQVGYYYTKNSQSINHNIFKMTELRLKFTFVFFKLIFEYSKNTKYEKDMANLLFTNLNKNFNVGAKLNQWKEDFSFFNDVVNTYLHNTYITDENKYVLEDFKSIIERKNKSNYQQELKNRKMLNMTLNKSNSTNNTNIDIEETKKIKKII
jgi:glycosyltransferase involved in cell wall biosynthesis